MPEVSVFLPVFNEEPNLRPLHAKLDEALKSLGCSAEIVYVDDGSSDGSLKILREIAELDPRVRVVALRRNYGQTAAMAAGIDAARGKVLIPMDADLQNDPADIARLLKKLDEGYDVVSGWPAVVPRLRAPSRGRAPCRSSRRSWPGRRRPRGQLLAHVLAPRGLPERRHDPVRHEVQLRRFDASGRERADEAFGDADDRGGVPIHPHFEPRADAAPAIGASRPPRRIDSGHKSRSSNTQGVRRRRV